MIISVYTYDGYEGGLTPDGPDRINTPGGRWDSWGVGSVPYHGKAMAGTNFIGPGPDGPNANPYKLGLNPVDAIDAAAQIHDYAFWKVGASGIMGALFDSRVLDADIALVNAAGAIRESYRNGGIDNITGLPISVRTYNIAGDVQAAFGAIVYGSIINRFISSVFIGIAGPN